MTVWLTPDREPFYGGTYFPPHDDMRGVQIGFLTLLKRLHAEPLLAKLRQAFVPNRVLSVVAEGDDLQQQALIPLLDSKKAIGGKVTAYVCETHVSALPTANPDIFAKQIAQVVPLPSEP